MFLDFVHDHTENVDFIYKGFAQEQLFFIVQGSSVTRLVTINFKHFYRRWWYACKSTNGTGSYFKSLERKKETRERKWFYSWLQDCRNKTIFLGFPKMHHGFSIQPRLTVRLSKIRILTQMGITPICKPLKEKTCQNISSPKKFGPVKKIIHRMFLVVVL